MFRPAVGIAPALLAAAAFAAQGAPLPACTGAWTGSITLTETTQFADSATKQTDLPQRTDRSNSQITHELHANIAVVEAPGGGGQSLGKASVTVTNTVSKTATAVERNSCDRGRSWQQMSGEFIDESQTGGGGSVDANVSIGVSQDGSYRVSASVPPIEGTTSSSSSESYSGQCWLKPGSNVSTPPTKTTIQGASFSTDGTHHVDPAHPDHLSGSQTVTLPNGSTTLAWSLFRCSAALRLTGLRFEHPKYPDINAWQEIGDIEGTTDGNPVRMKAKVKNPSGEQQLVTLRFKETYKGDKWDGAKPDAPLKDGVISLRLAPGEEREAELVWDSSGYAWFDDGRPRLAQRIKVELENSTRLKLDEMTRTLKVAPKPVVLVNGLRGDWHVWQLWQNLMTVSHSYNWKAYAVGQEAQYGTLNMGGENMPAASKYDMQRNAQALESYIRYAQTSRNAWHVDMVAHSSGGLVARRYINDRMPNTSPDGRTQIAHLLMMGTPNLGIACTDSLAVIMQVLGVTLEPYLDDLSPSKMTEFNRRVANRKGVRFSALAGSPFSIGCVLSPGAHDGLVKVDSVRWNLKDTALSQSAHFELLSTTDFGNFVKPRLAIGPGGPHTPDLSDLLATAKAASAPQPVGSPSTANARNANRPAFATQMDLAPRQTLVVVIPVHAATRLAVSLLADATISASLADGGGAVAGAIQAYQPEAAAWFRSIVVNHAVAAGNWKLKLQNTGSAATKVVVASWEGVP